MGRFGKWTNIAGCVGLGGAGFSLDEIRELLELCADVARPCDEVDRITAAHLADVERKIADLHALTRELRQISTKCDGGGTISNCRILDAIGSD